MQNIIGNLMVQCKRTLKESELLRKYLTCYRSRIHQIHTSSPLILYSLEILAILVLLVFATLIVYFTGGSGFAYPYLMLIPIILANAWFKSFGGLACAIVAGLLLGPLMPLNVEQGTAQPASNWVARLIMFLIISSFIGIAFNRVNRSARTENRTKLPNYNALLQDLRRNFIHLQMSRRVNKEPLTMIVVIRLIDLWEFAEAFGIEASDQAIGVFAQELCDKNQYINRVYSLGGSELALLVTANAAEDHQTVKSSVLEKTREVGERNVRVGNTEVRIQVSAGSYCISNSEMDLDTVISRARSGLTIALEMNKFHHAYEFTDDRKFSSRIQLISKVRKAISENEFKLFYQPKMDLKTGKLSGCEGLIRWPDGVGGMIPPGDFMPKVEKTSLIVPVTRNVVLMACAFINKSARNQSVSINWAAMNLLDDLLIEWLEHTIKSQGIDPSCIEIEITEGALINNPEKARENVMKLRGIGVSVSLDDFGTGYSSFQYLTQLPITGLKIDRSFVVNLENDPLAREVIKGIIDLAHSLSLLVTVEGIETSEQYNIVSSFGADFAQGYYIARPLPEADYVVHTRQPEITNGQIKM